MMHTGQTIVAGEAIVNLVQCGTIDHGRYNDSVSQRKEAANAALGAGFGRRGRGSLAAAVCIAQRWSAQRRGGDAAASRDAFLAGRSGRGYQRLPGSAP